MALTADDFITILATGTTIAAGASSSAATAIPNTLNGMPPTKLRITSTSAVHIKFGVAGVAAASGDLMVQPGDATRVRLPRGVTFFAVIQDTAAGNVTVSPVEDA